jgi:hypothetical protein
MSVPTSVNKEQSELSLLVLLLAVGLTFALSFVPFVSWLLYPLRLFGTFIHESGHALAALLSLGDVHHLQVNLNGSGVTMTSGGSRFLIGSAGYLGTTLYGVALLLSTQRIAWARGMLIGTGAVVLLLTTFYAGEGVAWPAGLAMLGALGMWLASLSASRSALSKGALWTGAAGLVAASGAWLWWHNGLLTWALGLGSGLALLAASRWTGGDVLRLLVAFLGIQVSMDALSDVVYLVTLSSSHSVCTDAHNMARDFGLPPAFWALFWCCLSALLVGGAVIYLLWRGRRAAKS